MGLLAGVAEFIVQVIATLGYPGLAAMMALESMLAPVPSEVVMPFAGFLVWQGTFSMPLVLLAALVGSVVGSLLSYWLGLHGGRPLLEKYGRWFLIGPREIAWVDRFFAKYGALAVFVGRFMPAGRHIISIPAGAARMPLRKFLPPTIVGAFAWNAFLAYVGFQLGPRWNEIGGWLAPYENAVVVAGVLAGVGFVGWRLWEMRRAPMPVEEP